MSIPYAVFWLVLAVIFAAVEFATPSALISVWFACGAVISAMLSFAIKKFWILFIIFVVVSVLSFLFIRPVARKSLDKNKDHTNADRLIGQTALVTDRIDNENNHGMVRVKSQIWTARTDDGSIAEPEETVKIKRIEGAKLIVERDGGEP